ncbi:sensor histidine kinase [Nonomuraea sp. SMC257]|uniref:Oxygen sensor histidine kinase NreB n=1 Tax=Nonomuraea montanisoli TaxID=2741721 RepID=A0A7Y6M5Q7_9ACTN|nr:sensor histidine kinase [Nonomuraea montanisoli]
MSGLARAAGRLRGTASSGSAGEGPEGRERLVHVTIAYGLLVVSTVAAALTGDSGAGATTGHGAGGSRNVVLAVAPWLASVPWPVAAGLTALWLTPLPWSHARRHDLPALAAAHYAGFLALAGILAAHHPAFTLLASAGYPLAVALLPTRLVIAGMTLTAAVIVAAQAGARDPAGLLTVIAGIAVPLVAAGWYVSAESDRRRRLIGELRAALADNADLHARLLGQARHAGVLDERHRVAGEIHDTVAQDLVALIGQLDAAGRADLAGHDADRRRRLAHASELARRGLSETRRAVSALRPGPLEDSRLPDALGRMADDWNRGARAGLTFELTGTPVALAAGVEDTLLRVAQEALANVAKHADATRTVLTLSYEDDTVLLDVRDDGTGFDPQAVTDGFGLDGMRRRVRGVGGTLEIESEPGGGTAVAATVPALPARMDDEAGQPVRTGHEAGRPARTGHEAGGEAWSEA